MKKLLLLIALSFIGCVHKTLAEGAKLSNGNLVHFSIPAADVTSAVDFYSKLFGWKFQKMTETYFLVEGGIGSISLEKEPVSGTMPILYFGVSNLESSLLTVTKLGGKILVGKTDAGDGRSSFATFADRNGNVIGLWARN